MCRCAVWGCVSLCGWTPRRFFPERPVFPPIYTRTHECAWNAQWVAWAAAHPEALPYVAISMGTGEEDFNKVGVLVSAWVGMERGTERETLGWTGWYRQ